MQTEITKVMQVQENAWNEGNLEEKEREMAYRFRPLKLTIQTFSSIH